jgi:aspartyl-tRNA(Asn)/glutamyl-tRNA(Gln) amidotransferase subunit A
MSQPLNPLLRYSLADLKNCLQRKEVKTTEILDAYFEQIRATENLNNYITVTQEKAYQQAERAQKRILENQAGALEGLPLAIKDAFCTQGILTTSGSNILKNFIPPYESEVTKRLFDAGVVMLGKTNMDEFCQGSTNSNSAFGPARNAWNSECTPGGSSGGSASAVAAGSAPAALGTDTGGSVRQPASFCGVVGVRPTYGRVSRWGITAFSSSLDQAGTLTKTVYDSALLLETICGYDEKDSTSASKPVPCFTKACGQSVKSLKVGIPKEWHNQKMSDEILAQWKKGQECLKDAGCQIEFVSLPYTDYALSCYYMLVCAEVASNLKRYDGVRYGLRIEHPKETLMDMYAKTRGEGFGTEVKRRILIGTYVLSHGYYDAYYLRAHQVKRMCEQDFERVFQSVDVLLAPTTPTPAFSFANMPKDPLTIYWNDILTVPVNVGGVCGISVPFGYGACGMPLGLQVIAPPFQEERLFQFGHILEQASGFESLIDRQLKGGINQ